MTRFQVIRNGDNAMHNRWWIGPGLAAAALVVAACGTNGGSTDPAASNPPAYSPAVSSPAAASQANATSSVMIKRKNTTKGTVLANAQGRTLYWFALDTSKKSNCNASCATYWQPVIGTAVAAPGTTLPHGFGTIKRADGQTQVTYDGHPLYTYSGDTAAGQVNGNDVNASGGLWWAMTPSGREIGSNPAPAPAASSSSTSTGSGGGGGGGGGW
jgi:predicted lipoprotein with Yx(FWY)xxD motif